MRSKPGNGEAARIASAGDGLTCVSAKVVLTLMPWGNGVASIVKLTSPVKFWSKRSMEIGNFAVCPHTADAGEFTIANLKPDKQST